MPYYPYFSFVQRPFEMGVEHLRLLDQAVTIGSAATEAIADAARDAERGGVDRRERARRRQPFQHAAAVRRRRNAAAAPAQDHAHLPRTDDLGTGRRLRSARRRQRDRTHRPIGLLGALQPAGPLRPHRRRRADPLCHVARVVRRPTFSPRRSRPASAITPSNPAASSSTRPAGWTPISRRRSWPTPGLQSARSPADLSPRSSHRWANLLGESLVSGEGEVIAGLDFTLINQRKTKMDARGIAPGPNCSAC